MPVDAHHASDQRKLSQRSARKLAAIETRQECVDAVPAPGAHIHDHHAVGNDVVQVAQQRHIFVIREVAHHTEY